MSLAMASITHSSMSSSGISRSRERSAKLSTTSPPISCYCFWHRLHISMYYFFRVAASYVTLCLSSTACTLASSFLNCSMSFFKKRSRSCSKSFDCFFRSFTASSTYSSSKLIICGDLIALITRFSASG